MTDLQAWLTGMVHGTLMRDLQEKKILDITVEAVLDEHGYLPMLLVKGNKSGDVVTIRVEAGDTTGRDR